MKIKDVLLGSEDYMDENKGCFAWFGGLYLIKNNLL
jgi:hypothetical protein